MAKKARKKRTRKRSRKPSFRKRFFKFAMLLFVAGALLLGGYMLYLSESVTTKFEGKRWAVPARVYARSLELYAGAPVTRDHFVAELKKLGYRKEEVPSRTGTYAIHGNRVLLKSRSFRFWDGVEPERFLDIRLKNNGIGAINDRDSGAVVDLVRLDPMEIGSIYPSHSEDRVILSRDEIPDMLVDTLLAVEDRRFYSHHGVDPIGLTRAVVMTAMGNRQGGSTLTQQLVKNMWLTPRRDLKRKGKEALMALILDARYEKDDILTAYVNEIYLGQDGNRGIHGFGLASHFYFGAPISELSLPQTALLVGMLKAPSAYNPRRNPGAAMKRRNVVLGILKDTGRISESQYVAFKAAPLGITKKKSAGDAGLYPAFMDLVRRQLRRDYQPEDLDSEGLQIFTTFSPWVQEKVEEAIEKRLREIEKRKGLPAGKLESAAVVVTPQDAEVLAVSGGRKAAYAGFNRALDASRPIGSLVKPAVYLTALQHPDRYSLVTLLDDSSVTLEAQGGKTWSPKNYDHQEHGAVALETALAKSYNLATVNLGIDIGVDRVINTLHDLGIAQKLDPFPSLFLGSVELTPLEVGQMYQTVASGGFRSPLRAIREVMAQDGRPLQRYPLTVTQASQPGPVYLLTRAMQTVVSGGTARYLNTIIPPSTALAGKTGTTDNLRDSWFAGFSGDMVTVVWVGRDDNTPAGLSGSSGALRVWGDIMKPLNPAPLKLIPPDTIELALVDPETGLPANELCEESIEKPFLRGYIPYMMAPCAGGGFYSNSGMFGDGGFIGPDGHPDFEHESWDNQRSNGDRRRDEGGLKGFLRSIFD